MVWCFRCTLLWARIGRIGAFGSGGSLPLRQNFAWKGSAATVPSIFGVSERAELSRSAARRAHGRDPTIQPYVIVNDVSRFVFRAVSHQGGNVLITDVVSNSAKH